jgi:CheY-like chemotaxis protein
MIDHAAAEAPGNVPLDVQGEPILLVEDSAADVALVRRAFRRGGGVAQLHVVRDGDAAVEYLAGTGDYADRARHPMPRLVLLDLKLPRRSGLEVLAWLRGQPGLGRLPVVILTSSREHVDVDRAYDLGVNGYLLKPVVFDDLQVLASALELYWLRLNVSPELAPRARPGT